MRRARGRHPRGADARQARAALRPKHRRHTQPDPARVAGFGTGNVGCMNPRKLRYPEDPTEEVFALVEVLRETEQRIEELTAGEVDAVAARDGRMFLLRRAQTDIEASQYRRHQVAIAQSKAGLHRAELMAKLAHVITGPDRSFEKWSETLPKLIGVAPGQPPRTTRAWRDTRHP